MPSCTQHLPKIVITPGEPAGIGPDLVVGLGEGIDTAELVIVADKQLLKSRAKILNLPWHPVDYQAGIPARNRQVAVWHVPTTTPVHAGVLDPANATYVLDTLKIACTGCLAGNFAALLTGPVHKGIINQAGYPFTGHTEWLANYCGGGTPVMLLATDELRVALVTTHLPLSKVSNAITPQRLELVIRVLYQGLTRYFGFANPRVLVCGLNPHAGEDGHIGLEEQQVIIPVLKRLRAEGLNLEGPLPADTAFNQRRLADVAAVLTMYHDQGLPVLKYLGFGRAANITLGLPITRISVDHGTAIDLAGTGLATAGSLQYALQVVQRMLYADQSCRI